MEARADDLTEKRVVPRAAASAEMIAILAVGVMLTGVVLTTSSWIRDDMHALRSELRNGHAPSELRERLTRIDERLEQVESGLGEVHERVMRIESVLREDSIGRHG